jgi:hypothetical protein
VQAVEQVIWEDDVGDQQVNHDDGEIIIREIIYSPNGSNTMSARGASNCHLLPGEQHQPDPSPSPDMKVFKIFLEIYLDDFGPFRSVYHALGGVYITFGNMPLHLRQKVHHTYLLGFVPFGVSFQAFIAPIAQELQELQRGVRMEIDGEECWVVVGMYFYPWLI